jgi:hypothetical protein
MFKSTNISNSRKKLGVYVVNGIEYSNKFQAVQACTIGDYPTWDFNDDVFSKHDWTIEPKQDLYELYRLRAVQIREKYDHVLLYLSGGIDSTTILRTFIDNDIKIDGVIITGTWKFEKRQNQFTNQEQSIIAVPMAKKLQQKQNFEIIMLDVSDLYEKYNDPDWIYTVGQCATPQLYLFNFYYQNPQIQKYLMNGSTCFIRGIDKPRVTYDQRTKVWGAGFLDGMILSGTPSGFLSEKQDWDIQEYFYWSPDLPQLAIKQAHIVYNYLKLQPNAEYTYRHHDNHNFDKMKYYDITDPLVYSKYLLQQIGETRDYFNVGKPTHANLWEKDEWILSKELEDQNWVKIWKQGIHNIEQKIDPSFLANPSESLITTTLRGCWSKRYNLA